MSLDPGGLVSRSLTDTVRFLGLTRASRATGIPRSTLWGISTGRTKAPSPKTVQRFDAYQTAAEQERQAQAFPTPQFSRSPQGFQYIDDPFLHYEDVAPPPGTTSMALRVRDPSYPDKWGFISWDDRVAPLRQFVGMYGIHPENVMRAYWDQNPFK